MASTKKVFNMQLPYWASTSSPRTSHTVLAVSETFGIRRFGQESPVHQCSEQCLIHVLNRFTRRPLEGFALFQVKQGVKQATHPAVVT